MPGTYTVTATVSDGAPHQQQDVHLDRHGCERAPVLTQPTSQTSAENATIALALAASDPDGNPLTYSATGLPATLSVNAGTGLITGTLTSTSAGTYTVTATVSDGALTNSKTFTWTVTHVNQAPVLTQPTSQTSAENTTIALALVASDPDGNPLTYSATGLPATLSVNAGTGLITGTLTYTSAGTYTVTATVSDGALTNSQTFTWTVTECEPAPRCSRSRRTQTSAENATITLAVVASDPDGDTLTYSATGLPAALSVNASTGIITGTLTFTSAGTYSVTATVSDGTLTNSKTFTWTVTNVNRAPVLTQPATQTSAENATISLPLVASDPDGNPLTYSATGLPASLSVNGATGAISGTLTFTSAGTYTVTATASDGTLSNSKTFTWTVTNTNQAPTLTQPANQTSAENATISLALVASDPDGTALTYSATGLPASLSINPATGAITGTLTYTSAGHLHRDRHGLGRHADGEPDLHVDRHEREPRARRDRDRESDERGERDDFARDRRDRPRRRHLTFSATACRTACPSTRPRVPSPAR